MWMDNWALNLPLAFWPTPTGPHLAGTLPRTHRVLFRFFESLQPIVVLANGNDAKTETIVERCADEQVPILRRKGGGGTVVLGPGCLILTFAFYARDLFSNELYFRLINGLWSDALAELGVQGVGTRGISDLAIGDKKLGGTSVFRKRHLLVYQGSLLVHPDFDRISRLLAHPTREPDYRAGRSHREFLTSLREQGFSGEMGVLQAHCQRFFEEHAVQRLSHHFVDEEVFAAGGVSFWAP